MMLERPPDRAIVSHVVFCFHRLRDAASRRLRVIVKSSMSIRKHRWQLDRWSKENDELT